ncbi:MAG: PHP domain-containing protein [Chlamydiota bacterium]|nr:PHP domain-containing protein [Chlamydiota bacterium]
MKRPLYDLHIHTTASDGLLDPLEMLHIAHKKGLRGISITDHDTCAAYSPSLFEEASRLGISLLTGIECSTHYCGRPIHLLGYGVDTQHPALCDLIAWHTQRREDRNAAILDRLRQLGMEIRIPEYRGQIGRPHIARALVEGGHVPSLKEAFRRYLGEGRKAYVEGERIEIASTIDILHQAGGRVILAHPHLIRPHSLIEPLIALPIEGIECHYGTFPESTNSRWIALCKERGWHATGGSDCHGEGGAERMGRSGVGEEAFMALSGS